jgi:hypothetical protein
VNRPRSAAVATGRATAGALIALITVTALSSCLSSCATFNRNDVAAKVGDRSLSTKAAETLAAAGQAATGDQLREELTKWIRVSVLEASSGTAAPTTAPTAADLDARLSQAMVTIAGDQLQTTYEAGVSGSPVICLAAITVATIDDANNVLAQLNSGTSFADAARQFSTDTTIAQDGGIVRAQDGSECIDPAAVNPNVITALKDTPIGQPIAASLDTFSAVLMLRPFDDLLLESKSKIAGAVVSQDQLDTLVSAADIYVDPRYGRWDPDSGAVVTLTS